jgi:RNase P subunit RPR2
MSEDKLLKLPSSFSTELWKKLDAIRDSKKLICGKCNTEQIMFKRFYGKKENEYSWYCPKCNDLISQSAVREVKEK